MTYAVDRMINSTVLIEESEPTPFAATYRQWLASIEARLLKHQVEAAQQGAAPWL
jgi:hypothetical protein